MTERPKGLIPGSGRRGGSRALDKVVSARFNPRQLARVRELAAQDGLDVSSWIRNAAAAEVHRREQPPEVPGQRHVGWQCQHMNMTSLPGVLGKVTSYCGCEMQPVYAAA